MQMTTSRRLFPVQKAGTKRGMASLWLTGLLLVAGFSSARAFTPISSDDLVFVNVDHAPVGAGSTFTYGYKGDKCGLGMSSAQIPCANGKGGVVIALQRGTGLEAMPFIAAPLSVATTAAFFPDNAVRRKLTPCTDEWTVGDGALNWISYTPAWRMPSLDAATPIDKKRFFLPATWMVFTVKNTTSQPEDFYFGLPVKADEKSFSNGSYQGFAIGEAAFAVKTGSCDLLTGSSLSAALNGMSTGFAFHMPVAPGETKSLTVAIAYYRSQVVDRRLQAPYYYTTLFGSIDDVIDSAMTILPDAEQRCGQLNAAMLRARLNPYRHFLASDALHSYQASTLCLEDSGGNIYWREWEGAYNNINTFDLTVDHAFYDAVMYPWALRNVLDAMSGASNQGVGYTFDHPVYDPVTKAEVSPSGYSFHHDMGQGLTSNPPTQDPTQYESYFSYMGQEQLQNWILCAGLYWSHTHDNAWLAANKRQLQTCLNSMLLRDDVDPAKRDGITSYINLRPPTARAPQKPPQPEITTYDSLDASLKQPYLSGRTTVRSWACYLALEAMFKQLGDSADAGTSHDMALTCASTIVSKWNAYGPTLGYIPAFLDGSNQSATIPLIEGLPYAEQMGLITPTDLSTGPFAPMLQALKSDMVRILVPGKCLDATSGGWKLTSHSTNTWQSKVYLCQYAAEKILGITGDTVDGAVDQVHATFQMQEAPFQGWSDQINSTGSGTVTQSLHYPRGITSSLWWLQPGD